MDLTVGLGLNRHGDMTVWRGKGMKQMNMGTGREKT